jgi:hypothetical protein
MQQHHDDDSKACLTAFVQDNTVMAVIESDSGITHTFLRR